MVWVHCPGEGFLESSAQHAMARYKAIESFDEFVEAVHAESGGPRSFG